MIYDSDACGSDSKHPSFILNSENLLNDIFIRWSFIKCNVLSFFSHGHMLQENIYK